MNSPKCFSLRTCYRYHTIGRTDVLLIAAKYLDMNVLTRFT